MANTVDMPPGDLAELLGLPRDDGPAFGASVFRLDNELVQELRDMRGPIELTFVQINRIFGIKVDTLRSWRTKGLLACRAGGGARVKLRVAPSELIRRLRQIQSDRRCFDIKFETPGQASKRQKDCQDRMSKRINLTG